VEGVVKRGEEEEERERERKREKWNLRLLLLSGIRTCTPSGCIAYHASS